MKNSMLCGALFTLICAQVQAEGTQQAVQVQSPEAATTAVANNQAQTAQTMQTNNPQATQNPQVAQETQATQPQVTQQQPTAQPTQQAAPVLNCDYKIPASTTVIDQTLVVTWSENATIQAFNFDPASLDTQLKKLQTCFTDQGWQGYNAAMQKSGNIEAIKSQKLTVSSQIDGQAQIIEAKDNQWQVSLPLQVVYQNDKEKVTQLLNVKLTVGRKINGDLGITQMIAAPRAADATQPQNTSTAVTGATVTPSADSNANQQPSAGSTAPIATPSH